MNDTSYLIACRFRLSPRRRTTSYSLCAMNIRCWMYLYICGIRYCAPCPAKTKKPPPQPPRARISSYSAQQQHQLNEAHNSTMLISSPGDSLRTAKCSVLWPCSPPVPMAHVHCAPAPAPMEKTKLPRRYVTVTVSPGAITVRARCPCALAR